MPIATARPNTVVSTDVGWSAVGAASMDAATSDDSDASYARINCQDTSMVLGYDTPITLAANERVLRMRNRTRGFDALDPARSGPDATALRSLFTGRDENGILITQSTVYLSTDAQVPLDKTGPWLYFDSGSNEWDQTDIAGLQTTHSGENAPGVACVDGRLMESYLEIEYRRRPVVLSVTRPIGPFFTRSPVVEFTSSMVDTEDSQHRVQVRVFRGDDPTAIDPDTDVPVYDQTRETELTTFPLFTTLEIGEYVAFVRVSKEFLPAASGEWFSEWVASPVFSILPIVTGALPVSEKHHRLGCGHHRVFLQERGGGVQLFEFPWEYLTYRRLVDEMTDARIEIGTEAFDDAECVAALVAANPWEHEISIWRDEDEREKPYEAWVGPLIEPDVGELDAQLFARDLFQWTERRRLPTDRDLTGEDLAQIFNLFFEDAMGQDTSPNIAAAPTNTGVTGSRSIRAAENRRAADELRELARSGVDFSMFGRTMLIGGEEVPVDALATVHTSSVRNVRRKLAGLETGTESTVVGAGGGPTSDPIFARTLGDTSVLGLVQLIESEQGILDSTSAQQAADTRQAFRDAGVPQYITCDLTEDAPISHQDLIPGARVPLAIDFHGREIVGDFRLREVTVEDGADGERTSVVFAPLGTVSA